MNTSSPLNAFVTPASTANDGTIAGAARQNRLLAAWWLASESARGFRGESSRTPCAIAFADQVARLTGDVRVAQYLLGSRDARNDRNVPRCTDS